MKTDTETGLISRKRLAERWETSLSSIIRMEKKGQLTPLTLGVNIVRYRLSEIAKLEANAEFHSSSPAA